MKQHINVLHVVKSSCLKWEKL